MTTSAEHHSVYIKTSSWLLWKGVFRDPEIVVGVG
jgi:hypothetical protein